MLTAAPSNWRPEPHVWLVGGVKKEKPKRHSCKVTPPPIPSVKPLSQHQASSFLPLPLR